MAHLNLVWSSPNFHCILECASHTPYDTPLIYDLGAYTDHTLFKSDFIHHFKCSISVHDISKVNEVIGIGTTIHKFVASRVDLSVFKKWLITSHHLRLAFWVFKSFFRFVEGKASSFGIKMRFTLPIRTSLTFPLMSLHLMFQLFEIQCTPNLRRIIMVFSDWRHQFCWTSRWTHMPWHDICCQLCCKIYVLQKASIQTCH